MEAASLSSHHFYGNISLFSKYKYRKVGFPYIIILSKWNPFQHYKKLDFNDHILMKVDKFHRYKYNLATKKFWPLELIFTY